jgi:hypothetical protein
LKNGLKIILNIITVVWLLGVATIFYYSNGIGPGVYISGAIVGLTWAAWYFMDLKEWPSNLLCSRINWF